MNISITWHGDQFNVELAGQEGSDAFLSIKGCRIVDGAKGAFVSWPATKNQGTGKWWAHVWAADRFNEVVLAKAQASVPKVPRRQPAGGGGDDSGDIPFNDPLKSRAFCLSV